MNSFILSDIIFFISDFVFYFSKFPIHLTVLSDNSQVDSVDGFLHIVSSVDGLFSKEARIRPPFFLRVVEGD